MSVPGTTSRPPSGSYDVVVVGAGVQGLATAYELARRGAGRVAVLDASYPGSGASGRNGELIRSGFGSPEWIDLFELALTRWHRLSSELGYNVLFTPAGYAVLASTEEEWQSCREAAAAQAARGVETELLDAERMLELAPELNPAMVRGGVYQRKGGFAHHDAVLWGYARAAAGHGVEIHPFTRVTGIGLIGGRVESVDTAAGRIGAGAVVDAAGAYSAEVAAMAGVELEVERVKLEMIVTESLEPFLRPALAPLALLGYCHQTTRGEFVGGTELPHPVPSDDLNGSFDALRDMAAKFVRLFPRLAAVRIVRHWAGLVTQARDLAPVLGPVPGVDGLHLSCGWVYGFMAAPASGELIARAVLEGRVDPRLQPFGIERLRSGRLIEERTLVVPAGGPP